MSRKEDVQKLITLYNRRLQKLREEEARKGYNTPSDTLTEIEDITKKLAGLSAELETTSASPNSLLTDQYLSQEIARLSDRSSVPASSTQMGGFNMSNISGSTLTIGNVDASVKAGGDVVGRDKITATSTDADPAQAELLAALVQWRQAVEAKIAALPDLDAEEKAELQGKVDKAEQEAAQGTAANPGKLERLFNTMGAMIPDIVEVTATILQNPFKGVGLVLQKINDRIKLEREAKA